MPQLTEALVETKESAVRSWYLAVRDRYPSALVPDWRTGTAEDGAPRLTVQVIGEHAQEALHHFASAYPLALANSGDLRPVFEYRPGRVVCVWRTNGVWVEMWHHDLPAVPAPSPALMPQRRLPSPSGRLPLSRRLTIRRQYATKEN
ncbi:hypothetical protein OG571_47465 (plasmid) [Streptomyces sp. NBC_01369]|uniref:hypothetical protein n=1 Tax=Streptomyces sp. NBC_01369 TaxID=2903842 RepID=UPI002F907F87